LVVIIASTSQDGQGINWVFFKKAALKFLCRNKSDANCSNSIFVPQKNIS
jgi:hypothetical protein